MSSPVYEQYADRLKRFAYKIMPDKLKQKFDPEDVAQSTLGSFFRTRQGDTTTEHSFDTDFWPLLALMLKRKMADKIRHHIPCPPLNETFPLVRGFGMLFRRGCSHTFWSATDGTMPYHSI